MATEERTSTIARHLRHYYRSAPAATVHTQAPYSYSIPETNPAPHAKHRNQTSLRSKLKDTILKVPTKTTGGKQQKRTAAKRPPIMRMKDSDDYITARAANPWTGVVSPSIGSPSPRTPETPGEALLSHRKAPISPTPSGRVRPSLNRARPNDGRKVSAGSIHKWRADVNGWVSETALASPRQTDVTAGASLTSRSQSCLSEDRFVVQMPSAREPQPYAHPGRTEAEIEAFDYYTRRTRKVSREGYGEFQRGDVRSTGLHAGVGKRSQGRDQSMKLDDEAIIAATFAPFASPHTPSVRAGASTEPTALRTVQAPRLRQGGPAKAGFATVVQWKPVSTARSCSLGCEREADGGDCQAKAPRSGGVATASNGLLLHLDGDATSGVPIHQANFDRDTTNEILVAAVSYPVTVCKGLHLPNLGVLSALRTPDATPRQKVDALRALLALAAQVTVFFMVWSVIWRLGSAVMQVLELVLWPLVMPIRVLRWMAGCT